MEEALKKMDVFFNPRSVAIIGATKKVDKAGHVIFKQTRCMEFSKVNSILLIQMKIQF